MPALSLSAIMKASCLKISALCSLLALISACSQPSSVASPEGPPPFAPGIAGQVTDNHGTAATGAYVYAYRNPRSNLRGPADFEAQVDAEGHYFLDLVEGDYYLVARLRESGADAGPPKAGDAWALPEKNPLTVLADAVTTVNFVLQGVAQPMLMREGTLTGGDTPASPACLSTPAVKPFRAPLSLPTRRPICSACRKPPLPQRVTMAASTFTSNAPANGVSPPAPGPADNPSPASPTDCSAPWKKAAATP